MEKTIKTKYWQNVPLQRPIPAINEENFNWKLWNILKVVYDKQGLVLIDEIQPIILRYENIYRLLPVDVDKRINFNTLGIVLGYKYYTTNPKNYKKFINENKKFLKNEEQSNGLDEISLIRYIEYFKKSK